MATMGSTVSGGEFTVVTVDGCDVRDVQLIKFNYAPSIEGSGLDYLRPVRGDVNRYEYQNDSFGEEVASEWVSVSVMNLYDPVDVIVRNLDLSDLNCNAVYEVEFESGELTNCTMNMTAQRILDVVLADGQIALTDCIDFNVFTEAELDAVTTKALYYPDYKDPENDNLTSDEEIYYKTSYLASIAALKPHFYGNVSKPEFISVATSKSATFTTSRLKIYVNVNYAPLQLKKYMKDIYNGNITAVYDYYFDFSFAALAGGGE